MTYEQLAALVADPEDLDAIAEDLFDRITELRHLDRDWWGWE